MAEAHSDRHRRAPCSLSCYVLLRSLRWRCRKLQTPWLGRDWRPRWRSGPLQHSQVQVLVMIAGGACETFTFQKRAYWTQGFVRSAVKNALVGVVLHKHSQHKHCMLRAIAERYLCVKRDLVCVKRDLQKREQRHKHCMLRAIAKRCGKSRSFGITYIESGLLLM